ncbi:MAG: ParB/RepB/Spo0J family partition protein [Saprospirales bacterium]|nr:MAG: ParB/RepB/Spo0J family partition protein [Saprospirales bacterium]
MAKMKKKELGLGIRALLSNVEEKDTDTRQEIVRELSSNTALIPVDQIEENPFQPRKEFHPTELNELSESIRIHGLIQPITVRRMHDKAFQIISGERRWRATKNAGLTEIPAYIRLADDQAMLEMALIENIQRKDLNPMEIAFSLSRLLEECQLTHEGLSERVSKSRSSVTNYLRLLKLPPKVQESVKNEVISMGHARALAGIEDTLLQMELLELIEKNGWSVRTTEETIKRLSQTPDKSKESAEKDSRIPSKEMKALEDKLLQKFGANTHIKEKKSGEGEIVIRFEDREHLNQLLEYFEII